MLFSQRRAIGLGGLLSVRPFLAVDQPFRETRQQAAVN
jgi:hypothetical protein